MDTEGEMNRNTGIRLVCLAALLLPACDEEQNPTAPALSSTCEARPATGPAPLAVSFLLNISGAQGATTVAINYGDGQTGTNPDVPHSYAAAGSYTASFDVTTSTQSARCTAAVSVSGGTNPAGGNQSPTAVFKSTPAATGPTITGSSPLDVTFNMCASSDPEGDQLYFLADYDGDGKFDFGGVTGGNCRSNHVYTTGNYTAEMCLYDRDKNGKALHDDICKTYLIVVP
jgi:PKD domain-containing protein